MIGGLAIIVAYFMPWLALQNVSLTGSFLGEFLGGTNDLRRFLPGSSGSPTEVMLLRALVYLFPACGALAASLALAAALRPGPSRLLNALLVLTGLVPLIALSVAVSRLPTGSAVGIGLWQIGAAALAVLMGVATDTIVAREGRVAAGLPQHTER